MVKNVVKDCDIWWRSFVACECASTISAYDARDEKKRGGNGVAVMSLLVPVLRARAVVLIDGADGSSLHAFFNGAKG